MAYRHFDPPRPKQPGLIQDEGNPEGHLAMLAERLAVIGGQDHQGATPGSGVEDWLQEGSQGRVGNGCSRGKGG